MNPLLPPHPPPSRRSILVGGLGVAGAAAVAACGGPAHRPPSTPAASSSPLSPYVGDLRAVALSAALENLVVAGYALVLKKAAAGAYGAVPPAVATLTATVHQQHQDHATAWNALLTTAGKPPLTGTPLRIAESALAPLTAAQTVAGVATAAAALELVVAQTCLDTVRAVSDEGVIALAASIGPVEARHAAVLSLIVGTTPVPQSYLQQGSAVPLGALTA